MKSVSCASCSELWKLYRLSILGSFSAYSRHYHFYFLFPPPGSKWLLCALLCPQRPTPFAQECGICARQQCLYGRNQTPAGEWRPTINFVLSHFCLEPWCTMGIKFSWCQNPLYHPAVLLTQNLPERIIQFSHWHKLSFQDGGFTRAEGNAIGALGNKGSWQSR